MFKKKEVPFNNAEEDAKAVERIAERIAGRVKDLVIQGSVDQVNEKIHSLLNAEDTVVKLKRSISTLEKKISNLELDEAQMASKRRIADTEIKALVKVKEDQSKLDLKALEIELKNSFKDKELELIEKFHKDLEGERVANQQRQDIFFDRILQCLPNVNLKLGQEEKKAEDAKKVS
jgi:hypothetical protein